MIFQFVLAAINILFSIFNQPKMNNGTALQESQYDYLKDLISPHLIASQSIEQWVININQKFTQKIQDGQQIIMQKRINISLPKTKDYSRDIAHYHAQNKQLQERLTIMSKSQQKEPRQSLELSEEQRLNFVKRMKQKQQQVKHMKQQNARIREEKERMREEQQKLQKEIKLKQEQNRKRRIIQKRLKQIQEQKERRAEEIRQRNRQYQQIAGEKTLFHRLEENYSKIENANLQEKKKKLALIRQIHKPMSRTDFEKHAQQIKQYHKLAFNLRSVEKEDRQSSPRSNLFYKSHWYKQALKEQKNKEQEQIEEKKEIIKQLKDRQKKYSEYIKHNYMPESDDRLIEEIQKRFHSPIKRKKAKQIRQIGLSNLKEAKQKKMSKEQLQAKRIEQARLANALVAKPKNYLEQIKMKRRSNSLTDNFLTKVNKEQKAIKWKSQSVKNLAEKLQRKAEQREQLQRIKNSVVDTELDEMYMKLLNAKLKLLSDK